MQRHQFVARLINFGVAVSVCLSAIEPASALPGQKIQTVVQWSQKHPFLPKLTRQVAELSGLPYYFSQVETKAGTVVFNVSPTGSQNQQVGRETIAYAVRRATKPVFTATNEEGLALIEKVYDRAIVNDFRKAKAMSRVNYTHHALQFYRGQRYGYITTQFNASGATNKRFFHFSIVPLKDLNAEIISEQQCRKQNPDGCGD